MGLETKIVSFIDQIFHNWPLQGVSKKDEVSTTKSSLKQEDDVIIIILVAEWQNYMRHALVILTSCRTVFL